MSIKAHRPEHRRAQRDGTERDPTHYPVEKKMGEDSLQTWIVELLRPLIERWYSELGRPRFVGADQFIYYQQFDPSKVVAPDVYVLPGVAPGRRVRSWKVWETGMAPSFALEVASSDDPYKEYADVLERYRELGVKELVIFDPDWERGPDRVRWLRYRKLKTRGFVQVETTNADRIYARVLGCWLRAIGAGEETRLRLATGPEGEALFPTAAEAERAASEMERAASEMERAASEMERVAKQAALSRIAELEAQIASAAGAGGKGSGAA
ncbi:Uma2 family endonuclease [Sorangium sp. So ce1024]|uniref:Uma2 family endonuclease n=1 Tax=Sorangium sp. So ce1024 TaxID=3133327 RepID=UPI003EFC3FF2